jgi:hypothetical protein
MSKTQLHTIEYIFTELKKEKASQEIFDFAIKSLLKVRTFEEVSFYYGRATGKQL